MNLSEITIESNRLYEKGKRKMMSYKVNSIQSDNTQRKPEEDEVFIIYDGEFHLKYIEEGELVIQTDLKQKSPGCSQDLRMNQ